MHQGQRQDSGSGSDDVGVDVNNINQHRDAMPCEGWI